MGCQVSTLRFQISQRDWEGGGRGLQSAVLKAAYWPSYRIMLWSAVRQSGCISEMSQIQLTLEYLWSHLHDVDAQKATEVNQNIFHTSLVGVLSGSGPLASVQKQVQTILRNQ